MNTGPIYSLFDNTGFEAIFISEMNEKIFFANRIARKLLKTDTQNIIGKKIQDLENIKFRDESEKCRKSLHTQKRAVYESELKTENGNFIPVEIKQRKAEIEGKEVIISAARDMTEQKNYEKKLLRTIIETEEKERKRFAADLHDGLSPLLSTIRLYADLLKEENISPEKRNNLLENIDQLADMAISTAKDIAVNITPGILEDFGLAVALEEFCKYVNDAGSLKIELKTQKYKCKKRGIAETILYQSTKELINNALKHSQAENIKLELKSNKQHIFLYYKDDGIGFDVEKMTKTGTGLGLKNIINKIKTIKGSCDFYSREGEGTILMINVNI